MKDQLTDTPATSLAGPQGGAIWADRFIKRELIPAGELARRFNILNPRSHPEAQRDATESSLDTVGWIDEISLSTNGDGPASLNDNPDAVMFDGHERVELVLVRGGESALVPVKWYQLSAEETDFALLVKDQTTEMAKTKPKELAALLERTRTTTVDPRLGALLNELKLRAANGILDNGRPLYSPELTPQTSDHTYNEYDITKKQQELDNKFSNNREEEAELICPHCGKIYYVRRKDIA